MRDVNPLAVMANPDAAMGRGNRRWWRGAGWLALVPLVLLGACKPAKTVEYYRKNDLDRDRVVNRCLATNANDWDCINAITAEAERWGVKDIDGYTVMISGDTADPNPMQSPITAGPFTETPAAPAAPPPSPKPSGGK